MKVRTIVAASCFALCTEPAVGGGFALHNQSASGLGNAFAGAVVATEDASTIFYNPAGLTRLSRRQAVVTGFAVVPSFKFSDRGSTPAAAQPPGSIGGNGGDGGDFAFIPNAYLSWQLTSNIFAGVGFGSHFGLKTEYDSDWVGRFHAIKSELRAPTVNPSIAYKMDSVSLGLGISYQRVDAELTNAVNYSGAVAQAAPALIGAGVCPNVTACIAGLTAGNGEGGAKVQGDDGSWGWNVGAIFELNSNTQLGVAYRSSIRHKLAGDVAFSGRPVNFTAVPALAAAVADSDITANVKLPAFASLGVAHRLSKHWQLLASVDWTDWSSIQSLAIVRSNGQVLNTLELKWKDAWRVGLGLNYSGIERWTFRFGIAFDESPITDPLRSPRLPDSDRLWMAVGAQYKWNAFAFDAGYLHEFFRDSTSNLTDAGRGNLIGRYKARADVLGAQLRFDF